MTMGAIGFVVGALFLFAAIMLIIDVILWALRNEDDF